MPYLSKQSEIILEKVLARTKEEDINKLICADEESLNLFSNFEKTLIRLKRAREEQNTKTWNTIKERRKADKKYCR